MYPKYLNYNDNDYSDNDNVDKDYDTCNGKDAVVSQ